MGAVLLAKDPAIDRVVAIKLIQTAGHLSSSQSEKYRERFYREASAAGQLLHPNIATVFDVGHTDDGTPFIVMEYVKGQTLREALETETFSVAETMRIARDVLDALRFAHSQGIVHRDVKPGNIMITPDRHGKIMDFGIAHVVGSELTSAEDVLGSPYYMAPEQLSKGPIGPHTDLFAFAVVLYRMLTGVLPFTGESFAAIAHAILHESPAAPELFSAQIPKALSQIVLRCLEKSPEDRYQSAEQALRDSPTPPPGRRRSTSTKSKEPVDFARRGTTLLHPRCPHRARAPRPRGDPRSRRNDAPSTDDGASGAGAGAGAAIRRTAATRADNGESSPSPHRRERPRYDAERRAEPSSPDDTETRGPKRANRLRGRRPLPPPRPARRPRRRLRRRASPICSIRHASRSSAAIWKMPRHCWKRSCSAIPLLPAAPTSTSR